MWMMTPLGMIVGGTCAALAAADVVARELGTTARSLRTMARAHAPVGELRISSFPLMHGRVPRVGAWVRFGEHGRGLSVAIAPPLLSHRSSGAHFGPLRWSWLEARR